MKIVANMIADGQEEYLPVFERLEVELEQTKLKSEALGRARSLSRDL